MKTTLFFLTLISFHHCWGQVPPQVQQQLEARAENEEAATQLEGHYLYQLEYFRKHPININATSADELQQLKILTEPQLLSLMQYEKFAGILIDIYELQAIPGFDLNTIKKLLPYIIVGEAFSMKETF